MGLFGGDSSSSSTTKTTTTTNTSTPQLSESDQARIFSNLGQGNTVQILDGGAFELAREALSFARENQVDALEALADQNQAGYTLVGEAVSDLKTLAKQTATSEDARVSSTTLLAAAGLVGFIAWRATK